MISKKSIFLMVIVVFLVGCTADGSPIGTTFLGGSEGLTLEFLSGSPPEEVFDNGQLEFGVAVQVRNSGEYDVESSDGYIQLDGILASEYGLSESEMRQNIPALRSSKKNFDDTVLEGEFDIISFDQLSYQLDVPGNIQNQRINAIACYNYQTRAVANICVREDAFTTQDRTDICTVTGQKTVSSSGGPVQVTSVTESLAGQTRIQVAIEVSHVGDPADRFFKPNADCNYNQYDPDLYRVFVKVSPIVNEGISPSCSGFIGGGGASSGFVFLQNGQSNKIICNYDTGSVRGNSETPLNIELEYRYMDSISKPILIKDISVND